MICAIFVSLLLCLALSSTSSSISALAAESEKNASPEGGAPIDRPPGTGDAAASGGAGDATKPHTGHHHHAHHSGHHKHNAQPNGDAPAGPEQPKTADGAASPAAGKTEEFQRRPPHQGRHRHNGGKPTAAGEGPSPSRGHFQRHKEEYERRMQQQQQQAQDGGAPPASGDANAGSAGPPRPEHPRHRHRREQQEKRQQQQQKQQQSRSQPLRPPEKSGGGYHGIPENVSVTDVVVFQFRVTEEHVLGNVSFALFGEHEPAIVAKFKSLFQKATDADTGHSRCLYRGSVVSRVVKRSHILFGAALPEAATSAHHFFPKSSKLPREEPFGEAQPFLKNKTSSSADQSKYKLDFLRGSLATVHESDASDPTAVPPSMYPEQVMVVTHARHLVAQRARHWDVNHTVFGHVVVGMHRSIGLIERMAQVDKDFMPAHPIVIDDCWVFENVNNVTLLDQFVKQERQVEDAVSAREGAKLVPGDDDGEEDAATDANATSGGSNATASRGRRKKAPTKKRSGSQSLSNLSPKNLEMKRRAAQEQQVRRAFSRQQRGGAPEGSSFGIASRSLSKADVGGPNHLGSGPARSRRQRADKPPGPPPPPKRRRGDQKRRKATSKSMGGDPSADSSIDNSEKKQSASESQNK